MKTYVREFNEEYSVDAKTTSCTIHCRLRNPGIHFDKKRLNRRFPGVAILNDGDLMFELKASTTCAEGDTYNAHLGKCIALRKARYKMLNKSWRIWRFLENEFDRQSDRCSELAESCWNASLSEFTNVNMLGL